MSKLKDFLITWTDLRYDKQYQDHARGISKNDVKLYGYDFPHRMDKIEEVSWDAIKHKWVPKSKPYGHSKIPIIEEPTVDFVEYGYETVPNKDDIVDFDTAHKIAVHLLKTHPNVVIMHEGGNNWFVGELDPITRKAGIERLICAADRYERLV